MSNDRWNGRLCGNFRESFDVNLSVVNYSKFIFTRFVNLYKPSGYDTCLFKVIGHNKDKIVVNNTINTK